MIDVAALPTVNAALNATSAVLLVTGWLCIRARRVAAHRTFMLSAFASSTLFLASYVYYHAHVGSKHLPGTGLVRTVYLTILATHVVLAMVILPLVLITLYRAVRGEFDRHRRIARITLPLWIYVSVTGVVVYWMLYRAQW